MKQEAIANTIYHLILREVKYKARNVSDKEDLIQEAFYQIYKTFKTNFDKDKSSLETFVSYKFDHILKEWWSGRVTDSYKERVRKRNCFRKVQKLDQAKKQLERENKTPTLEAQSEKSGLSFREIDNIGTYCSHIVSIIPETRREERYLSKNRQVGEESLYGGQLTIDEVVRKEDHNKVWKQVKNLPTENRKIMEKYYLRDFPEKKIAQELNIPVKRVQNKKQQSLKKLRKKWA